jgi:hypothetical protein
VPAQIAVEAEFAPTTKSEVAVEPEIEPASKAAKCRRPKRQRPRWHRASRVSEAKNRAA